MNVESIIEAGVCGFQTTVKANCEDGQHVSFDLITDCEKIAKLADKIHQNNPVDAFQEISPVEKSKILEFGCDHLNGCCAGCVVPVGIFKTMQVASGLALPKSISIQIEKK